MNDLIARIEAYLNEHELLSDGEFHPDNPVFAHETEEQKLLREALQALKNNKPFVALKPLPDCQVCKGTGTYKVLGSGGDYEDVECLCSAIERDLE